MNKLIFSHFALLITLAFMLGNASPSISIETCLEQAFNYGNGEGDDTIDSDCHQVVSSHALLNAKKESSDATIKVSGFKNLLYIEKDNKYW